MGLLKNPPMEQGEGVRRGWDHGLNMLLKLGRMKMTVFSAVTYGAGASVANLRELDSGLFLWGWAFVFFTQMVAHLLGLFRGSKGSQFQGKDVQAKRAESFTHAARALYPGDEELDRRLKAALG